MAIKKKNHRKRALPQSQKSDSESEGPAGFQSKKINKSFKVRHQIPYNMSNCRKQRYRVVYSKRQINVLTGWSANRTLHPT